MDFNQVTSQEVLSGWVLSKQYKILIYLSGTHNDRVVLKLIVSTESAVTLLGQNLIAS